MSVAADGRLWRGSSAWLCLCACSLLAACKKPSDDAVPVGSKGLWVASGTTVVEYVPRQLSGGTAATAPQHVIQSAAFGAPQSVTFDQEGNLWVADPAGIVNGAATPALFEISAAQLASLDANNAPAPVATIVSPALVYPQQAAFDTQGNLWVTDHATNAVVVFTQAQVSNMGRTATEPAILLTSPQIVGPVGLAFDAGGNLWLANNGPLSQGEADQPGTTIIAFHAGNLPAAPETGTQRANLSADIILSDDGHGSIAAPWALTFDAQGNLWSSNAASPYTLVEFAPVDLAASGAPVPLTTLGPTTENGDASLDAPNGLCFDDAGNLAAISSAHAFGIALFSPDQLTTGSPVPYTFIVGAATTLKAPAGCAFGP